MNGLYVGTFDPITIGHLDIIKRAANLFDKLYILVANNSSKHTMFSHKERESFTKLAVKEIINVEFISDEDLTTPDIMKKYDIKYLVRGARNLTDLDYEHALYNDYCKINPDIEEILLWGKVNVSSTFIRECINYNKWDIIKQYIPNSIIDNLMFYSHG